MALALFDAPRNVMPSLHFGAMLLLRFRSCWQAMWTDSATLGSPIR